MDSLDQKILSDLQLNGFRRSKQLAECFDVSSRTVRRRIRAMKDSGLFKVIAVPNLVRLGYKGWAKIGIKVTPDALDEVARKLVENPTVYFVACSIGKFDFIIAVDFESLEELSEFVNSELIQTPTIQNAETMILNHPRKYYNFLWPVDKSGELAPHREGTKLRRNYLANETDRRIINLLREDGSAPCAVIKEKLNLAEGTLRKHMNDMVKNEVFKLEIAPNPAVLEYEVWATIGIAVGGRSAHKVIDDLIKNPSVYLASTSIGRFNIVISVRFHNVDSFTRYLNTELRNVKEISFVESFVHSKPLKYHNVIWPYSLNSDESMKTSLEQEENEDNVHVV